MNHLTLTAIDDVDEYGSPCKRLQILIDGTSFLDLVREVELPFATRERMPSLAGKYIWLRPYRWTVDALSIANLSKDAIKFRVFLQCDCEMLACWPLRGQISLQDDKVVWQNFENHHRGPNASTIHWRYDRLGPFVFAPEQYQAEVNGLVVIDEDE